MLSQPSRARHIHCGPFSTFGNNAQYTFIHKLLLLHTTYQHYTVLSKLKTKKCIVTLDLVELGNQLHIYMYIIGKKYNFLELSL